MTTNANNSIVMMAAEIITLEEADREAKWHEFIKRTEPQEEKFKPVLRAAFTKQEMSVIAKLGKTPVPKIKAIMPEPFRWDAIDRFGNTGTLDGLRNQVHNILWVERDYTKTLLLSDIILLKASDEAEAASEAYVDAIYTASAWQETFEAAALPFVTTAYKIAGQAAYTEIGFEGVFNVTNPRARKYLETKVFKFAEDVNAETREKIRRALVKGLDAGEGIPAISKRIAGVFDINRGSRTDMIAQTEIVGASNNATHQAYVESEIVITEIWIDSRDDRVRTSPHNHALDGEERKLGERFSNGLLHPHDPNGAAGNVIRCRCTTRSGKLKEAA